MRRGLCISLILLLWLGPLAAVLPGISESRLPFCCRRHGVHHCAMDAEMASAQSNGSGPEFSAPSRCPQFPAALAASTTPAFAAAEWPVSRPAPHSEVFSAIAHRDAAPAGQLRIQADRGPPSSAIA